MNSAIGEIMKGIIPAKPNSPRKQFQIIRLAVLIVALFFSAWNLYADDLNECLMEALKNVDDSVTVGQLREQYQQESENVSSPAGSNGPEELILKTPQARKPSYFPHKKHQGKYTCDTCHHGKDSSGRLVKYTTATTILKCTACHNTDMPNEELNNFKLIGHKLCRECHRKNQDITSAKCSTCHRKNL